MSVNGITNAAKTYDRTENTKVKSNQNSKTGESKLNSTEDTAAVYEKSDSTEVPKKSYKTDTVTIERLKAETDRRTQNLRNLVEKLLTKQGKTFNDATDIYALLREGKVQVDPETKAQAQKDIADDGYWGVKQTSERMVSFAKALTGGDPSKADEMIAAVKKGFEQATKAWGGALPDICKQTLDTAISELEAWRDGKDAGNSAADAAEKNFTGQAATAKTAE